MKFYVAYYPEHTNVEQIRKDAQLMKECGIKGVRIGEFAWPKLQPNRDVFDFEWMDYVIDILSEYNISTVIGTPTAVVPKWLIDEYPQTCQTMDDGQNRGYGARRNACINDEFFISAAERITEEIAKHYKDNKNVIAYQIDNELMAEKPYCYCEGCENKFRELMKQEYKDIEKLNDEWGLSFWGLNIPDWSSLVFSRHNNNPSAQYKFLQFTSDSYIDFAYKMYKTIRCIDDKKIITHNICSCGFLFRMDLEKICSFMDVVSFDLYPTKYHLEWEYGRYDSVEYDNCESSFALSLTRAYKKEHFWIMEKEVPDVENPKLFRLFTFQEMAHGCRLADIFQWRKFQYGQEQGHGSVLMYDSKPRGTYNIIKETIREIENLNLDDEFFPKAEVAIVRDFKSDFAFEAANQSPKTFSYLTYMLNYYKAVIYNHYNCDVIMPDDDFSEYKVVIAPAWIIINENYSKKIKDFVRNGGIYLTTSFSAIRNENNVCYNLTNPSMIDDVCGIEIEESNINVANVTIGDGCSIFNGSVSYDIINLTTAKPLYFIVKDGKTTFPVITKNPYYKGVAYYIGTMPQIDFLTTFLGEILDAVIEDKEVWSDSKNVEIIKNIYKDKEMFYVLNFGNDAEVYVKKSMSDIISGNKINKNCKIGKRNIMILIRDE